MSFYYVLWIPQTTKEEPQIIEYHLGKKLLRDIRDIKSLCVCASIAEETRDITLKYQVEKSSERQLIFHYVEQDDRGFVIYKLDLSDEDNDFLCELLRIEMPNALYHYFKGFFHRHIFHDDSADSLLTPYFSKKPNMFGAFFRFLIRFFP